MKKEIQKILKEAIKALQKDKIWPVFKLGEIQVDYPNEEKFGDYSSNIAMLLAKKVGKNPMEIAEQIVKLLNGQIVSDMGLEKIEMVAPGYINFYLSEKYLQNKVLEINKAKENFGKSEIGKGLKVNNEFISANPTGPLTVGNGRGGFYGDALSNVLRKAGFEVVNEYFENDAGEQINKLKDSVDSDEKAVYKGDYIEYLRNKFKGNVETSATQLSAAVLDKFIQPTVLGKMKIKIDVWMSEKSLYDNGYVGKAIEILENKKLTYEKDGALWLKTTEFGDDKDRVLIKSDGPVSTRGDDRSSTRGGQKTYLASDCGYILNKIERGFDKIIEIWGADHHGYISRFKAAAQALGFSGELKFIIVQLVRLVKDGQEVRMSKRAGNVVYIDELIDKVGHDTARFFFLMYCPDTHMNFDLKLAEERSEKNPVFYVQYAHARICSLFRKAEELKIKNEEIIKDLSVLDQEKELSLIKELDKFPELIEEIAKNYAVHKLPQYAIKLADKFHSFYNDCKILDGDNLEVSQARLKLTNAVKIVLAEVLRLIGVEAPIKM
jgi:arginyl-tRNA synthetase